MTKQHVQPDDLTTLTLDGTYQAIGFFSARAAVKHLITNRAKAYDRFGNLQDWTGWVENTAYHYDDNPFMNSASQRIDIPTIMVVSHYFAKRARKDRHGTNLRHIYKIYDGKCQYCLKKIPFSQATKDHIFPKSQGGPNCSQNLILACKSCNTLKADTFPYFNAKGEEPKPKNILPVHYHQIYRPDDRPEWEFFLHAGKE